MSVALRTTLIAIASCAVSACGSGGSGTTTSSSGGTTGGTALPGLDGGAPCADGGECSSTACLGGRCCNDPCPVADPACAATACDETGICAYPGPSLSCGPPSCQGPLSLSQRICDGNGDCILGSPNQCPANYACNPATAECNQTCLTDLDCDVTVAFCNSMGACVPKLPEGSPCLESAACASRSCLGGFCCVEEFCPPAPDTNCLANACSYDGGGCLYPACSGGLGCGILGGKTCLSRCASTSDCISGMSCDQSSGSCCTALPPGVDFYVDGYAGLDTGCCGSSSSPCNTLTRAMDRLSSAGTGGVSGATIHAFNSDHSLDWTAPERWPVHLGLGVTLVAPKLYFDVSTPGNAVFKVFGYSASDLAPVTVEGDPAQNGVFTHVGFPANNVDNPNSGAAFDCGAAPPVPLNLSNAWLYGTSNAVIIGAGASVTVGPLPVTIGTNGLQRPLLAGATGIRCQGLPGQPAELSDQGAGSLRIDCQTTAIAAGDNCIIGLAHAPVIGLLGTPASYCGQTTGLLAVGSAQVFLGTVAEPATVRWFFGSGLELDASDAGSPSVVVAADVSKNNNGAAVSAGYLSSNGSTFTGNSNAGVAISGGFLAATASSLSSNSYGLLSTGGAVDLSGDGGAGTAVTCNSGVDVVIAAPNGLDAEKIAWDNWNGDAGTPTLWLCPDAGLSSGTCHCISGYCAADAGAFPGYPPFGTDAVFFEYNAFNPLNFFGGKQASPACH
jgi:hypothetical protein